MIEEGFLGVGQAILFGPVHVFSRGHGFGAGKSEVCDFEAIAIMLH